VDPSMFVFVAKLVSWGWLFQVKYEIL